MEQAAVDPPARYNLRYVWLISVVAAFAEAEVRDIQSTLSKQKTQRVRFQDLLEPKMTKFLLIGVTLAVLQQWTGINVIFNYAEEIFRQAGYGVSSWAERTRRRGGQLPRGLVSARLE